MSAEQKEELIRQPRLLLESFNLSEKALNAGDQADMELVFKNRSSSQGIYLSLIHILQSLILQILLCKIRYLLIYSSYLTHKL